MEHREVALLAVGAGPGNLAVAVAVEELAPDAYARDALVIEQAETVAWQRGMLLPGVQSQVSFLKDVATLRNPLSRFTFVNYLHETGRLSQFVNLGRVTPYRVELSDYFHWVAASLAKVRVECSQRCVALTPRRAGDGPVTGWVAHLADGSTIGCRHLVVGAGREPNVPAAFAALPPRHVIHSAEYRGRIAAVPRGVPQRVVVIGGAQSAAEMFDAVQHDLPGCHRTIAMRSIAMRTYENSKFTNEHYFPSAVDDYYGAGPAARRQILGEMHLTNYSALAEHTLESIYEQLYLDRLSGKGQLQVLTMVDVTDARHESGEVVLELTDRRTGRRDVLRCDLVLLGTGFRRDPPPLVRGLADRLGLARITVNRNYRLDLPDADGAACYLVGVNEATHGISDSLLSMMAPRAADIVGDLLADLRDAASTKE
ncbi:SidA/IucD/PvdA family monooxygenase [Dactylosporangium sp. AC04546]|uniref:SidA/IucD/PvdA family monooxygenase n=1 Tax=Dactylosporangium sp. AC04546 TaxID=2862460 RepID=UPI001EE04C8F|nr:SidA/IucD/PvdA family monooxygenase [Dactylosporangium sp. AC04546]WVK79078.1 SidA/IucD/PvdA family monooxygenase [Dactylosporangium sp. AC04546]